MSLFALVAAAGCLAAPAESDSGMSPRPTSICAGDPGPPALDPAPWSIASLPGWSQADAVADDLEDWLIDTAVFNHVLHGSIAAAPDGQVTLQGGDLEDATQSCAAVVAAHRLGYPILVVLGGDRGDDFLAQATAQANRPVLVATLMDFIDLYGYDGVSIAWVAGVAADQLTALVDDLSAEFRTRTPRPLLTVDVSSDTVAPSVSAGWVGRVDAINVMSYGADWQAELGRHLDAGIPPELIDLGIGLSVDDSVRADVKVKIDAAIAMGLHGVESWELGALESGDDPRLPAYAPLLR